MLELYPSLAAVPTYFSMLWHNAIELVKHYPIRVEPNLKVVDTLQLGHLIFDMVHHKIE